MRISANGSSMKQLNIHVTEDQHKKLRLMAANRETTIRQLLSQAIDNLLKGKESK